MDILRQQEEQLTSDLDYNLMDIDSIMTEEIIDLKGRLSFLRRQKSKLLSQLHTILHNSDIKSHPLRNNFEGLKEFFPKANIKRFEEIEQFHSEIAGVLCEEFAIEEQRLQNLIHNAGKAIDEIEGKIREISTSPNLSKSILKKHAELKLKD